MVKNTLKSRIGQGHKIYWINVFKYVKGLYKTNIKFLKIEIEGYTIKWKDILCLRINRFIIVKIIILAKATDRLNGIPIKMPTVAFTELWVAS